MQNGIKFNVNFMPEKVMSLFKSIDRLRETLHRDTWDVSIVCYFFLSPCYLPICLNSTILCVPNIWASFPETLSTYQVTLQLDIHCPTYTVNIYLQQVFHDYQFWNAIILIPSSYFTLSRFSLMLYRGMTHMQLIHACVCTHNMLTFTFLYLHYNTYVIHTYGIVYCIDIE